MIATPATTATNAASAGQRRRQSTAAMSCVKVGRGPAASSGRAVVTGSPGAAAGEESGNRLHEDLEVEPGAPVLDVEVIPLDAVGKGGVPAQAVDLRPTGQPGLHAMALRVAIDGLLEELDVVQALRPRSDQRHVAAQHVPELRQLVHRRAAQELADRRPAVRPRARAVLPGSTLLTAGGQ